MIPIIGKFVSAFNTMIGNIRWRARHVIPDESKLTINQDLKDNYFIILTRRDNHLSTYAIGLAHFFLTGKFGYYSHALMNLEDEVKDPEDFRLVEATIKGIHYSSFDTVFGEVSATCLLKPKSMTIEKWTLVMDAAKTQLGKPYDTLFDLKNDNALSCVELVRLALMNEPDYATNFADFEKRIAKSKNLDPHMFYECSDFEVVYEVKRKRVVRK